MESRDDLALCEAQLLLVSLQQSWNNESNRSFDLMNELDTAEQRLLALFSAEWEARGGQRQMINFAYSEYRKQLMLQFRLRAVRHASPSSR